MLPGVAGDAEAAADHGEHHETAISVERKEAAVGDRFQGSILMRRATNDAEVPRSKSSGGIDLYYKCAWALRLPPSRITPSLEIVVERGGRTIAETSWSVGRRLHA